jgi:hypothetical protein
MTKSRSSSAFPARRPKEGHLLNHTPLIWGYRIGKVRSKRDRVHRFWQIVGFAAQ